MVENALDDRKVEAEAGHSGCTSPTQVVQMPVRHCRQSAVQGSLGVRPVGEAISAISAKHGWAFPLRMACREDCECWFGQRHLMGATILDASRWEGDEPVGKVDLGPL